MAVSGLFHVKLSDAVSTKPSAADTAQVLVVWPKGQPGVVLDARRYSIHRLPATQGKGTAAAVQGSTRLLLLDHGNDWRPDQARILEINLLAGSVRSCRAYIPGSVQRFIKCACSGVDLTSSRLTRQLLPTLGRRPTTSNLPASRTSPLKDLPQRFVKEYRVLGPPAWSPNLSAFALHYGPVIQWAPGYVAMFADDGSSLLSHSNEIKPLDHYRISSTMEWSSTSKFLAVLTHPDPMQQLWILDPSQQSEQQRRQQPCQMVEGPPSVYIDVAFTGMKWSSGLLLAVAWHHEGCVSCIGGFIYDPVAAACLFQEAVEETAIYDTQGAHDSRNGRPMVSWATSPPGSAGSGT